MLEIEDNFLNESKAIIDDPNISLKDVLGEFFIESMKEDIEKDKNKPFVESYKNIVEKTATFLNSELLVEDPITASIVFEYLLWKGYFSKNHLYQFDINDRKNNFSAFGADIMRGKGVCLNNAYMLSDILNSMDYKTFPSMCFVNAPNGFDKSVLPPIERTMYEPKTVIEKLLYEKSKLMSVLLSPMIEKMGNHAIVSIEYNNDYFAIDPTNLCFMTYYDENSLQSLNENIKFQLKPGFTRLVNANNVDEIKNNYDKANLSCYKSIPYLNNKEIGKYYIKEIDYLDSKRLLLDDFHKECLEDIDVVCKTLKKR